MAERNRVQALFPQGAEPLPNPIGTAPGIWMRLGRATVACLPGVPSEMKRMFLEQVVPRLQRQGTAGRLIVHRKINLFGKGESDIETQAMDLTARGRVPEVGITAHDATISFRITAAGDTEEEARALIQPTMPALRCAECMIDCIALSLATRAVSIGADLAARIQRKNSDFTVRERT